MYFLATNILSKSEKHINDDSKNAYENDIAQRQVDKTKIIFEKKNI